MEMQEVYVVAILKAQAGKSAALLSAISEVLLGATRAEEGCIQYALHQDMEDENTFVFYEIWQSAAHLEKHSQSAHMQEFKERSEGMIASGVIHKLK